MQPAITSMKATETQVGGSHYITMTAQPIELITALDCSFIQGCIIKYICRYRMKNGAQDLLKCIHYSRLANQFQTARKSQNACVDFCAIKSFSQTNKLHPRQYQVITAAMLGDYSQVIDLCKKILQAEYPEQQ